MTIFVISTLNNEKKKEKKLNAYHVPACLFPVKSWDSNNQKSKKRSPNLTFGLR